MWSRGGEGATEAVSAKGRKLAAGTADRRSHRPLPTRPESPASEISSPPGFFDESRERDVRSGWRAAGDSVS